MKSIAMLADEILSGQNNFAGFELMYRSEIPIGAQIYLVEKNDDTDPEADPIIVTYIGGTFFSSSGEANYFDMDDVPQSINFNSTEISGSQIDGMQTEIALRILLGKHKDGFCPEGEALWLKSGHNELCQDCAQGIIKMSTQMEP